MRPLIAARAAVPLLMHAWACRAWDLNSAVHSHHVTRTVSGLEKGRGLQSCDHSCDSACNAGCDSSCDMIHISCDSSCNGLGLDLCLTRGSAVQCPD